MRYHTPSRNLDTLHKIVRHMKTWNNYFYLFALQENLHLDFKLGPLLQMSFLILQAQHSTWYFIWKAIFLQITPVVDNEQKVDAQLINCFCNKRIGGKGTLIKMFLRSLSVWKCLGGHVLNYFHHLHNCKHCIFLHKTFMWLV